MRTLTRLTIAGVGIQVSCEEKLLQKLIASEKKTGHYFTPDHSLQQNQITIHISSIPEPPAAGDKIIQSEDSLWKMQVLGNGYLDCRYYEENPDEPSWWSSIDSHFQNINIGLNFQVLRPASSDHSLPGGLDDFATDRKLMIPALLQHGVLLVHGAGGVVQDRGLIIAGPSGSGKSTMATLFTQAGHRMFCDECMAVRKHDNSSWLAYGTPWNSSAGIARDESTPLSAILFLQQEKETAVRRLTRKESLKRILQFSPIPWYLPAFGEKALSLGEQLINEIPMFELNCSLNDQPVKEIERLAVSL